MRIIQKYIRNTLLEPGSKGREYKCNPLITFGKEVLVSLCNLLEANGIDYCVTHGTLLGLHRSGDLIVHDNDIDLCVPSYSVSNLLKMIPLLEGDGFTLRILNSKLLRVNKKGVSCDLFIFKQVNPNEWAQRPKGVAGKLRTNDFKGLTTIKCNGEDLNTVENVVEYLEERYGPTWCIPIPKYKGPSLNPNFNLAPYLQQL